MLVVGNKIIVFRKAKDWSQAELARAVEASIDIIGEYERNENSPSVEMALKIAKVFDVPVDYLLGKASTQLTTTKRLKDWKIYRPLMETPNQSYLTSMILSLGMPGPERPTHKKARQF